jgi:hypothetical protein
MIVSLARSPGPSTLDCEGWGQRMKTRVLMKGISWYFLFIYSDICAAEVECRTEQVSQVPY